MTEHEWKRDANGEIDLFVLEYENHNGPGCVRCDYSYCHHCQDGPSEPCDAMAQMQVAPEGG